jgi:polar amino acid transport system substrate-binding protein
MRKLAAALLLIAALPLGAEGQELVFAIGEWAPYTGESLPEYGYAAKVVKAACGAAGIRARFEFYPWNRAELRAAEGNAFATFPFVALPERESRFFFSDVLIRSPISILRSAGNESAKAFRYGGDPIAFAGSVVGTTFGSKAVTEPLRRVGVPVEETASVDQSLVKLEKGRIDFVVDERIVLIDAIRRLYPRGADAFVFLERNFLEHREYRVLVSRRHPDARTLLERFNAGLAKIRADGTIDRIRASFGL